MTSVCAWCATPLPERNNNVGGRERLYCSDKCRHGVRKAYGGGFSKVEALDRTLQWDGKTQYHDTPQRKDYFLTCMACARHVSLKLTDSDTRLIPQQRCQHCGGRMLLEPDAGKVKFGAGMTSDVRAPAVVLPDSRL